MDLDELFDTRRDGVSWRDKIDGEALELCEKVEARIEETRKAPSWTKLAEWITDRGYPIGAAAVGQHYRNRYPFLKRK